MYCRLAVLVVLLMLAQPTGSAGAAGSRVATLADPRIDEASGLAVARRTPGVLFVQNDSGDSARFFAVSARTGQTLAVCSVPDATNVDWEDLATGPDAAGTPSVWLADIGDNDAVRSQIQLYRVDEPLIGSQRQIQTGRPDVWRLRYPDGAHNAETLLVDPVRHRQYLVTKDFLGRSEVFEVPAKPDAGRVQLLTRVGSVTFSLTGTPGGPNLIGQLTATGGSVSSDGRRLVIRTYTDAYLWTVSDANVAAALKTRPTRVALPAQPLGEGVAFESGASLLVDSEGVSSGLYRVAIPPLPAPSTSVARPLPRPSAPNKPAAAEPEHRTHSYRWVAVGLVVGAFCGAAAVLSTRRRH